MEKGSPYPEQPPQYSEPFCKLAIRKIFMPSLFSPVKKRNILCSRELVK